jgi:pimeloyl-ACP methyl ester carboxylesterase
MAAMPAAERRIQLAGISTTVLEGGDGPLVVLLHGPAANATHWLRVIPDLVSTHRVVAPDLPGHGRSEVADGRLDATRLLDWLGDLIEKCCAEPPLLVGHLASGALAARYAVDRSGRLRRLVLVDSFGFVPFQPAPDLGRALGEFVAAPSDASHDDLWRRCAFDLDALRDRMGAQWAPFRAYNVDRARAPSVQAALGAFLAAFAGAPIPPDDLARISVPTTLIWGRNDLATPVEVAEGVSARYGWPLHVIGRCADDPPVERPEALLEALRAGEPARVAS